LRELDGIIANEYPYILEWTAGFQRIAYQNRFGHPDYYFSRIGDYRSIMGVWWVDPERERRYQQALADPSVKLEVGPLEVRYWQEYAKKGGTAFEPPK
jgi:hypothetical protein